jgi:sortase (surface protein transpeptidase)
MQIDAQEQHRAIPPLAAAKEGDVLGRIEIPRLGMTVAILEGTTSQTLRLGVGHIEGTALPGEPGNIGIAGHRDTYFRALKDIRAKDEIQIETATGLSRYEVESVQIGRIHHYARDLLSIPLYRRRSGTIYRARAQVRDAVTHVTGRTA